MNVNVIIDDLPSDACNDGDRVRPSLDLAARMLSDAMPKQMIRDAKRKRCFVAIIEVHSPEWVDYIQLFARTQFRPADFIIRSEPLGSKVARSATQDISLRSAVESGQSVVVIVTDAGTQVTHAIRASADYHVVIPAPTDAQLRATLRAVYGNARIQKIPAGIGLRAPPSSLIAAIRPAENAGRAVARLRELDRRLRLQSSPLAGDDAGPSLDDLSGYGPAKDWGLALASDLEAYRRGELHWSQMSTAALLHGEPGTGKTLFASALARTCQIPLVSTSLGQLFASTDGYLSSLIKGLDAVFQSARAQAPSLLFIDEIDAIPNRLNLEAKHREYWTSLITHLLKLIDDASHGVIIVGATNLKAHLDPALIRAGRLELHFEIKLPTTHELEGIFRFHLAGRLPEAHFAALAELALGATGADVAFRSRNAIADARRAERDLTFRDVANQFLRGDVDTDELHRIATHEAGHAVVALALGRQVNHASTVAIGTRNGGVLMGSIGTIGTRQRLEDHIVIALAGRAAEILTFGEGSSGCHADLEVATTFASAIHGSLGLGNSIVQRATVADATRSLADPIFRELIETELRTLDSRAMQLLMDHRRALDAIAKALEHKRALTGDELRALFA